MPTNEQQPPRVSARPWRLAELNYAQIKARNVHVAVLPLGATEPHNLHLPYGTDTYESEAIGDRICEEATRRGADVVLLPAIPYGTETNLRRFPFAMNLNPSTLGIVITDLVHSLVEGGIQKVLLLNGHGGNDLKPLLRELYGKTPAQLFLCNWFRALSDVEKSIFQVPGDHAGEMETSLIMAVQPQLVAQNRDGTLAADAGDVRPSRFEAVNKGWVNITRPWHLLTTNTGSGNPHAASKEKGEQMLTLLAERLGTFLVDLANAKIDDRFPF